MNPWKTNDVQEDLRETSGLSHIIREMININFHDSNIPLSKN